MEEEKQNVPKTVTTTTPPPTNVTSNISSTSVRDVGISPPVTHCVMPVSHVADHVLPTLWKIVYWTSQFLTW